MRRFISRILALPLAIIFAFSNPAEAALNEYQIKAGFIYQFTKFIQWPDMGEASFTICVYGRDPFGGTLNELEEESIANHRVKVVRTNDERQIDSCRLVFISGSERTNLPRILKHLKGKSILSVGESSGFLENGGIINFVEQNKKIRFQINQREAELSGIKISSKLLSLATRVIS